jgi:hypothetical protein
MQCRSDIPGGSVTTVAVAKCNWSWEGRKKSDGKLVTGSGVADDA